MGTYTADSQVNKGMIYSSYLRYMRTLFSTIQQQERRLFQVLKTSVFLCIPYVRYSATSLHYSLVPVSEHFTGSGTTVRYRSRNIPTSTTLVLFNSFRCLSVKCAFELHLRALLILLKDFFGARQETQTAIVLFGSASAPLIVCLRRRRARRIRIAVT